MIRRSLLIRHLLLVMTFSSFVVTTVIAQTGGGSGGAAPAGGAATGGEVGGAIGGGGTIGVNAGAGAGTANGGAPNGTQNGGNQQSGIQGNRGPGTQGTGVQGHGTQGGAINGRPTSNNGLNQNNPFRGNAANGQNQNGATGGAGGVIAPNGFSIGGSINGGSLQGGNSGGQSLGLQFQAGVSGLHVSGIDGTGLAQQAGLKIGDQVLSMNGAAVSSQAEIQAAMQQGMQFNKPMSFTVQRNGQVETLTMGSSGLSVSSTSIGIQNTSGGFSEGVSFSSLNQFGAGDANGLQISTVTVGSWAELAGLQANDRIVSVNAQAVASQSGLTQQLQTAIAQHGSAAVMVNRDGQFVPLQVRAISTVANIPTGNFSTDYGTWAQDFGQALQQWQAGSPELQAKVQQMGARATALQGLISGGTGQSADNVRILGELRTLRGEMAAFSSQSEGETQTRVNALLTRLNKLDPASRPESDTVPPPAPVAGSPPAPATVPADVPTVPPPVPPATDRAI